MNVNPQGPFQPSRMRQAFRQGLIAQPSPGSNYRGDLNSQSFLSQKDNLSDVQNCSLFITNIPTWVTYTHMFAHINTGAVFALYLMPPILGHSQQAAKLVFMSSDAAARFKQSPPSIAGQHLHVVYNRHGYLTNYRRLSRVLIIQGPCHIMNLEFWYKFFDSWSMFILETAFHLWTNPTTGMTQMEFRFARIDGQAETCLQAIQNHPDLPGVTVMYGHDPCASIYH
ncbi:hypothetical protein B0J14DRAFT_481681 [Halenospora varia]|nr:hypothetical protein B0J14DRAFT_481681 [Halenospora varia]